MRTAVLLLALLGACLAEEKSRDSYGSYNAYDSYGYQAQDYSVSYDKGWDQGYNSANVDYNSVDSYGAGADPDDYGKGYNTGYGAGYDAYAADYNTYDSYNSYDSYNTGYDSYNTGYGAGSYDAYAADYNTGYDSYNTGYDSYNTGYDSYNTGYDSYNTGYDSYNTGYDSYNTGYDSYNGGYGYGYSVTPETREGCPPEGFKAISEKQNLSKLAAGGQYAICQTPLQAGQDQTDIVNPFQWNHSGVFALKDSKLYVDNNIQVNIHWPGRLEWSNVVVTKMPETNEEGDGDFAGFHIYGKYEPGNKYSKVEKGHCANLDMVRMDGADRRHESLAFHNCSAKTTIKRVSVYDGQSGLFFRDCYGIIAYDFVGASDFFGWDGIVVESSHLSFIRPQVYSDLADGIVVNGGSSITVCDAFIETDFNDHDYVLGDDNDDVPSVVAVAGLYNSDFPEDIDFIGEGGLLYTIAKCPKVLKSSYEMKQWTGYWTRD